MCFGHTYSPHPHLHKSKRSIIDFREKETMISCVIWSLPAEFKAPLFLSWFLLLERKPCAQQLHLNPSELSPRLKPDILIYPDSLQRLPNRIAMLAEHKSHHPSTPRIRRISASVYSEPLRFISQLPGVKGMNDRNTLENSRKLQMSDCAIERSRQLPRIHLQCFKFVRYFFQNAWALLGRFRYFSPGISSPLVEKIPWDVKPPARTQHTVHMPHTPHRQLLSFLVTPREVI